MKQRLLVMNGQKLVQGDQAGQWVTMKVEKAGALKPGIYSLYLSTPVDKTKNHEGLIVHADKEYVYQKVGKSFIQHSLQDFIKLPELGKNASITYDGETAAVAVSSIKLVRGMSR